jgi:hypothetical protein
MKQLFLLFILSGIKAFAMYNGSPFSPHEITDGVFFSKEAPVAFDISYQKEMMFNRYMKVQGGYSFPIFSYEVNSGALFIDILDRISIYGTAGSATSDLLLQSEVSDLLRFISKPGFAWSIGANALALVYDHLTVGCSAGYQSFTTRFSSLGVENQLVNTEGTKQHFQDWQIAITVGYYNDYVVPYIGGKYTRANTHFSNLPPLFYFDLKSFDYVESLKAVSRIDGGLILGASFGSGKAFGFTIEANLVSERSLILEGQMRF